MRVRHRGCRGFTLVESLTTMVLLSAFLAIGCAVVSLMLTMESGDREHLALMETTARLERVFRDDVHEARRVIRFPEGVGADAVLVLEMPDGRVVRYESGKKGVKRVEEVLAFPVRADVYGLGGRVGRFSVEEVEGARMVGIAYDRRKTAKEEDPRPIRMEAAVGLDQRFRRVEEGVSDEK